MYVLCIFLLCGLTACTSSAPPSSESTMPETLQQSEMTVTGQSKDPSEFEQIESMTATADKKIQLMAENTEIIIRLYDTPTANALYALLPVEVMFSDYNGIEKIAYLPETLPTDGKPDGYNPQEGDFCLYAPWGNLSLFYSDFRYSQSLILLGTVESGRESIPHLDEAESVLIQAMQ